MLLLSSADFFQNELIRKIMIRVLDSLDPFRTNILSVLIWVQTVCKGYQQTIKLTTCKERAKIFAKSDKTAPSTRNIGILMFEGTVAIIPYL